MQLMNQLFAKEKKSFFKFKFTSEELMTIIDDMFNSQKSLELFSNFSETVKNGIRFYHVSNRPILSTLVIFAVISWQVYTALLITKYVYGINN